MMCSKGKTTVASRGLWGSAFVFAAAAMLVGCGGAADEAGTGEPGELGEEQQQVIATVAATETKDFPSWIIFPTKIVVEGFGTEAVPVHLWCSSTKNVYFTVQPKELKTFNWSCGGYRIWVHNQGSAGNTNQLLRVTTE